VSARPPVLLSGLTIGDYLLWNWSLNGGHDVLALIAGLSLPPLTVACIWLLAVTGARLLARYTRASDRLAPSAARRHAPTRHAPTRHAPTRHAPARPAPSAAAAARREAGGPSARGAGRSSKKLAA
jgi:hypothetical protein